MYVCVYKVKLNHHPKFSLHFSMVQTCLIKHSPLVRPLVRSAASSWTPQLHAR